MAFLIYKEPTLTTWRRRNPNLNITSFDSNIQDIGLEPGDRLFEVAYGHIEQDIEPEDMVSTDDIERVLEFQIEKLQSPYKTHSHTRS